MHHHLRAICLLLLALSVAKASNLQPNIVIIYTDDQGYMHHHLLIALSAAKANNQVATLRLGNHPHPAPRPHGRRGHPLHQLPRRRLRLLRLPRQSS